MTATATAEPQKMQFKTELKQLLDLIIHSLYTKKEIFLRELISNAADAIDKLRFEALTNPDVLGGNSDWQIRLIPDEKAKTLTVRDNGIGMSRDQVVEHLGTIAKSGTKAFLENLKQAETKDRPELIGQFGVGFYASFMAAERVTVVSQSAAGGEAVRWESDGQGEYTVTPAERPEGRGTDVTLHLREDAAEFLSSWRLREIVKKYSDFIEHPVVLAEAKEAAGEAADAGKTEVKDESLNSRQAIWLKSKSDVKPEDANAFYKQLSHDYDDPAKTIHISAEGGAVEFKALLFLPAKRGLDWMSGPEKKSGIDLYVRRVLIQHECEEVVPPYLRFVKGVVDCADLPLNVSRETLQHNPVLAKVKSNLTNRVLKTLEEMRDGERDAYVAFFKEHGQYLKEGTAQEWGGKEKERLADLLLFESTNTKPGEYTTLEKYVAGMKAEQKEIHYLVGESRGMIEHSPYLEAFRERGEEVLLLVDPIDEFLASSLHSYKDKSLTAVDRAEAKSDETDEQKKQAEAYAPLLTALKDKLATDAADVRLSRRLKESAAVLVAGEGAMSAHMERLMARMGRGGEAPPAKRVLELNPDHPAVAAVKALHAADAADPRVEALGRLLYDQAVIAEGSRIADPSAFARRLNDAIVTAAGAVPVAAK
ncbi:MAG: htpG [Phycisphaerales bacterium]|nr:htpG [Phycisphaerales bacterium]